jgi:hypothetical protein
VLHAWGPELVVQRLQVVASQPHCTRDSRQVLFRTAKPIPSPSGLEFLSFPFETAPSGCAMAMANGVSASGGQQNPTDMVIGVDFGMTQTGLSLFDPHVILQLKHSRSFILFSAMDKSQIVSTLVGKRQ